MRKKSPTKETKRDRLAHHLRCPNVDPSEAQHESRLVRHPLEAFKNALKAFGHQLVNIFCKRWQQETSEEHIQRLIISATFAFFVISYIAIPLAIYIACWWQEQFNDASSTLIDHMVAKLAL